MKQMRRLLVAGSAAIGLSAVVAVLVVTGTAGAKSNLGPACYPSNNMGIVAGTGWIGMDATAVTTRRTRDADRISCQRGRRHGLLALRRGRGP